MDQQVVGFASLLEGDAATQIIRLRQSLETEFGAKPLEGFVPPHLTFQGTTNGDPRTIGRGLAALVDRIRPFDIEVDGVGHFDRNVIYLRVRQTDVLTYIHAMIHDFLAACADEPFEQYGPKVWIPHVTLTMDNLPTDKFDRALDRLSQERIGFTQRCHNICMIKRFGRNEWRTARKYVLQE